MGNLFSTNNKYVDACKKDDIDYIKKIYNNLDNNDRSILFNIACNYNAINIALWIPGNNIVIYNDVLDNVIKNEYLEIFFILLKKLLIKTDTDLFDKSCKYNLNFVKLIYVLSDNLNKKISRGLINAINNQKLEIIIFLIDNEFQYNDDIFKKACNTNNIKIINYFTKLCPRYSYVKNQNTFLPIIEDIIIYSIKNKDWNSIIKLSNINKDYNYNFNENECAISLEKCNFKTNCNHFFEFTSLMDWYLKKNICPICNNKIQLNKSIIDYTFN